jgi:hypothetical protein
MTITLGGITLPDNMHLEGPFLWSGVAGLVDRSLGGSLIIWESTLIGGEPLDLVAEADSGWIPYATMLQLKALVPSLEASYELNYRSQLYAVRFRHEEAPVLDVEPLMIEREFESDSFYYGKIKLMVVE